MIPGIAVMLAAYMVPRLIVAMMAYHQSQHPEPAGGAGFVIMICLAGILIVLLALGGVLSSVPTIPAPSQPGL